MHTFKEISTFLERKAPLSLQESYDNAGLLTGSETEEVRGILCTLDCTEEIIEEAKQKGCNLIIAHHPIIFKGLKKLTGKSYVERTVISAIRQHMGIYAIHTNLDHIFEGVNARIADQMQLVNRSILKPHPTQPQTGSGMLAELSCPLLPEQFLEHLKQTMELPLIKYTPLKKNRWIHKVALCGGSGGFLLEAAIAAQADAFVSADFTYHRYFDAEGMLLLADIGHYESEKYTTLLLTDWIKSAFPQLKVFASTVNTNPVRYML